MIRIRTMASGNTIVLIWLWLAVVARGQFEIPRRLPPAGDALSAEQRAQLTRELQQVDLLIDSLGEHPLRADAEVFAKAVRWALKHDEFYRAGDVGVARQALQSSRQRALELQEGNASWSEQTGLLVRGYRSKLDDSVQPYGLWISPDVDFRRPVPLYVWLHGRGDQVTDLHFLQQRQTNVGTIAPAGAIVLHPFGRHCVGYKSAGEIDVLEAIEQVSTQYPIDPDRVALLGFSMGGAGAWHLGAHYADRWVAVGPGAGFAETPEYNRLQPEAYPPRHEQLLWRLYDVPGYVRNLFNVPLVVAYSGEQDKQIQAARVMEQAFAGEGRELLHLIGPGMGHKYHPEVLQEIMRRVSEAVETGRQTPRHVFLQTHTLRYPQQYWVRAEGLDEHWRDSRVEAAWEESQTLRVSTRNIARLRLAPPWSTTRLVVDGQQWNWTALQPTSEGVVLQRHGETWQPSPAEESTRLRKKPGLQGPIDDVFYEPFLVVLPSGTARHPMVQKWVAFEMHHQQERWQALFRGKMRVKQDHEVTADDLSSYHILVWGDPQSNSVLRRAMDVSAGSFPIRWDRDQLTIAADSYSSQMHVPVCIYPNPLNPSKYLVLNSGPTFRESHDRTNSLQNPKLPDWAVLNLSRPPDGEYAGAVVAAGFFDESWQFRAAN